MNETLKDNAESGGNREVDRWDEALGDVPFSGDIKGFKESLEKEHAMQRAEAERERAAHAKAAEEYRKEQLKDLDSAAAREEYEKKKAEWGKDAKIDDSVFSHDIPQVAYEDPDKYRKETTGTDDPEVARMVDEMSKFEMGADSVDQVMEKIINEPDAVNRVVQNRMRKSADFLYSWGDYNKDALVTDVNVLSNLVKNNFDFANFKVDLNNGLGGEPEIVDFNGYIDYFDKGVQKAKADGRDTKMDIKMNGETVVSTDISNVLQSLKATVARRESGAGE